MAKKASTSENGKDRPSTSAKLGILAWIAGDTLIQEGKAHITRIGIKMVAMGSNTDFKEAAAHI